MIVDLLKIWKTLGMFQFYYKIKIFRTYTNVLENTKKKWKIMKHTPCQLWHVLSFEIKNKR